MEKKLKEKEREMRKAQNALAGREASVADFLNACPVEQLSNKEVETAFEAYQKKVQAERDAEPEQEGSLDIKRRRRRISVVYRSGEADELHQGRPRI